MQLERSLAPSRIFSYHDLGCAVNAARQALRVALHCVDITSSHSLLQFLQLAFIISRRCHVQQLSVVCSSGPRRFSLPNTALRGKTMQKWSERRLHRSQAKVSGSVLGSGQFCEEWGTVRNLSIADKLFLGLPSFRSERRATVWPP